MDWTQVIFKYKIYELARLGGKFFCSHFELGSPVLRFNVQIGMTLLGSKTISSYFIVVFRVDKMLIDINE